MQLEFPPGGNLISNEILKANQAFHGYDGLFESYM